METYMNIIKTLSFMLYKKYIKYKKKIKKE